MTGVHSIKNCLPAGNVASLWASILLHHWFLPPCCLSLLCGCRFYLSVPGSLQHCAMSLWLCAGGPASSHSCRVQKVIWVTCCTSTMFHFQTFLALWDWPRKSSVTVTVNFPIKLCGLRLSLSSGCGLLAGKQLNVLLICWRSNCVS